jgi:predicted transcriptional regulator
MSREVASSISAAESVVMEVIWRTHPIGSDEILAALAGRETWQEATIKTLLNRLLKKGAISARKDGRRYLYTPILERDRWMSFETKGFLDRLFGGRVAPLVSHFSRHKQLSKRDLAELKRLIEELENGG